MTHASRMIAVAAIVSLPAGAFAETTAECIAYMEADAIHRQMIAATKPRGVVGSISETLFGPPEGIKEARRVAEQQRDRAYRKAYKGPRSSVDSVMEELIFNDVLRCMLDRFELGDPDDNDPLGIR